MCNILQKCDASVHVIKLQARKIKNGPFLVGTFHCFLLQFLRDHPCYGLQAITVAFERGSTVPEKIDCESFKLSTFLYTVIVISYSLHPTKEQTHSGSCNDTKTSAECSRQVRKN